MLRAVALGVASLVTIAVAALRHLRGRPRPANGNTSQPAKRAGSAPKENRAARALPKRKAPRKARGIRKR